MGASTRVIMRPRLLIISHELAHRQMAGAAIRVWEMARALANDCDVTLAFPHPSSISADTFTTVVYRLDNWDTLRPLIEAAEVILFSSFLYVYFRELQAIEKPVIIDGYDPFVLEMLMLRSDDDPDASQRLHEAELKALRTGLTCGDFFICASERQRGWWLGALEAVGRLNAYTVRDDPTLRRLVEVAPFGVSSAPRNATRRILRGVMDGIAENDVLVLWGGGLWQWLDPVTLIRAVSLLDDVPNLRMVFPGTRAPRLGESTLMPIAEQAIALADSLGLTNKKVFFGDWVPYEDWPNVLLESDIAVSLHHDHIETYLSWRTRTLGYLWAGLPMVLSRGDALAEMLEQAGMAVLTASGDAPAVAAAIRHWLEQPNAKAMLQPAARKLADALAWSVCVQPVKEFALRGARAPDKGRVDAAFPAPPTVARVEVVNQSLTDQLIARAMRVKWLAPLRKTPLAAVVNWLRKPRNQAR